MAVVAPSAPASSAPSFRACIDPVIFGDDRVLRTLLRKEPRYIPQCHDYFEYVQGPDLGPHMRKEVADWMLEVCEEQQSTPEVFCLAMNYLDRFLSACPISRSQLQLLGGVCLLVAWKVREHDPLPAAKLVEYSDNNLNVTDIMEWEVLLLSKLDWDMSSVIAYDFVEHIVQRLRGLFALMNVNIDVARSHSETLITMVAANGYCHFTGLQPSLIASACVLTTVRPLLLANEDRASEALVRETPSPGEATEAAMTSPEKKEEARVPEIGQILDAVENVILIEKERIQEVMDQIEIMLQASLPPSPASSPSGSSQPMKKDRPESPELDHRNPDSMETPTKVLDVAEKY